MLAAVDCDQPVSRRFDLGVADFDTTFEMENSEPERTKACKGKTRLTLSLKKSRARSSGDAATPSAKRPRQALQPTNGRFNAVSESELKNNKKRWRWISENYTYIIIHQKHSYCLTLYIHFLYAIDHPSLLPYTSLRADSYVLYANIAICHNFTTDLIRVG